jgi:hypothetical protein
MKVTTLVLNANDEPHFQGEDQIDLQNLFEVAKSKKQNARDKGEEWTRGAISFFGSKVVTAVNTGENKDVTQAIVELLLVTWVYEEMYLGATTDSFSKSDLHFTITNDGIVAQTKIPPTASDARSTKPTA